MWPRAAAARPSVPQAAVAEEAAQVLARRTAAEEVEAAARASPQVAAEAEVPSELPSGAAETAEVAGAALPWEAEGAEAARPSAAEAAALERPSAGAARPSALASPSLPFPFRSVRPPWVRTAHAMRRRRIASQSEWSWQAAPGVVFSWRSGFPESFMKRRGDQQSRVRPDCGGIQKLIRIYFVIRTHDWNFIHSSFRRRA